MGRDCFQLKEIVNKVFDYLGAMEKCSAGRDTLNRTSELMHMFMRFVMLQYYFSPSLNLVNIGRGATSLGKSSLGTVMCTCTVSGIVSLRACE